MVKRLNVARLDHPDDTEVTDGRDTSAPANVAAHASEPPSGHLRQTFDRLEAEIGAAEAEIAAASDGAGDRIEALGTRAGALAAKVRDVAGAASRAYGDAAAAAVTIETLIAEGRQIAERAKPQAGGDGTAPTDDAERLLRLFTEIAVANGESRRAAEEIGLVDGAILKISQEIGGVIGLAFYASAAIGNARTRIAGVRQNLIVSLRQSAAGNRRGEARIAVAIDAVLRVGRQGFCGRINDLSSGGALFRSASVESHGAIKATDTGEIGVDGIGNIAATVVSISPAGVHLRFDHVEEQVQDRLKRRLGIASTMGVA